MKNPSSDWLHEMKDDPTTAAASLNRTDLILSLTVLGFAAAIQYFEGAGVPPEYVLSKQPVSKEPEASPTAISPTRWKDVLWRTYKQTGEDRLLAVAAGVVFYGLLALFPAITALVSSYALIADTSTINDHLSFLSGILPAGTYSIVQDQVGRVLAKGNTKLGIAFLSSMALALWSANGGMKAILDALNVVYEEKETRGFFKLNAISLTFTFGSLIAVLCAIGLVVAAPLILASVGLGSVADKILQIGRWPALAVLVLLGLAILYRFGPNRRAPKWKWVSVGSVSAALTWLLGSALLSFYLSNYGNYDATYGSLGAAIGLMTWMWMSTIVVLFGAELNSEIEREARPGAMPLKN